MSPKKQFKLDNNTRHAILIPLVGTFAPSSVFLLAAAAAAKPPRTFAPVVSASTLPSTCYLNITIIRCAFDSAITSPGQLVVGRVHESVFISSPTFITSNIYNIFLRLTGKRWVIECPPRRKVNFKQMINISILLLLSLVDQLGH